MLSVIVLYVLVAVVAVGSVPVSQLVDAKDYALAVAARPTLGSAGFVLIGVAAMLSTASAINATLYGSARMTYTIAKARELPAQLERPIWNQPLEGLIITAAATLALANVLNLESISTMGSAGFLIIFATVNVAEARTSKQRASTKPWISIVAAVACVGALAALLAKSSLGSAAVLARDGRSVVHDRGRVPAAHRARSAGLASTPRGGGPTPRRPHDGRQSNTTATLPHRPVDIRAYASSAFSSEKRCVTRSSGWMPQRTNRSTSSSMSQMLVTHEP